MGQSILGGRGPELLGTSWALSFVATIVLALRAYTKITRRLPGTAALAWAITVWIFAIASNVMIIKVVQTGWGRHPIVLVEHRLVKQNWFWNGLLVSLGALAKGFSKIAVVSYILTWLNHDWTKRRYFLHFIAISNFVVSLAVFFMPLLACSPPSDLWNFNNQSLDACAIVPYLNLTYFHGAYSGFCDISLSVLPAVMIWPIRMPPRMKALLYGLLSLGLVAAALAFVRTVYVKDLDSPDYSRTGVTYTTLTITEIYVLLIASSAVPIYPLFRKRLEKHLCSPTTRDNLAAGQNIAEIRQSTQPLRAPGRSAMRTGNCRISAVSMGGDFGANVLAGMNRHKIFESSPSEESWDESDLTECGLSTIASRSTLSRKMSTVPSSPHSPEKAEQKSSLW